ncbi:hypothetical protein EXIGLDRAFT_705909 [Exidia glandulosa HHB12029]|uniref:Uncharacterized protein n=1 Tax=Exidia glandulosa HHB12029 TaxID=1314781 RepID=A0A165B8H4_EXIGL|nr:hypothetical protein EXIGLDRAFT_705909 [Exidia glandulosa HHB12029]
MLSLNEVRILQLAVSPCSLRLILPDLPEMAPPLSRVARTTSVHIRDPEDGRSCRLTSHVSIYRSPSQRVFKSFTTVYAILAVLQSGMTALIVSSASLRMPESNRLVEGRISVSSMDFQVHSDPDVKPYECQVSHDSCSSPMLHLLGSSDRLLLGSIIQLHTFNFFSRRL